MAKVAQRFGWTPSQVEAEDEGRVLRLLQVLHLVDGYRAVLDAVGAHRPGIASQSAWEAYKEVVKGDD